VRTYTKAYQAVLDTNATTTVSVDYDFPAWMQQNFSVDLARYHMDAPITLWLRRARGCLPNAKLESVDAANCSQPQFTEWLYFIRNTRDYVAVTLDDSKAA
jgi:hypothetical protein